MIMNIHESTQKSSKNTFLFYSTVERIISNFEFFQLELIFLGWYTKEVTKVYQLVRKCQRHMDGIQISIYEKVLEMLEVK